MYGKKGCVISMKQKKRNRIKPFDVINGIVLILLCVTIVVPFLHLFSLSLSPSYVATKGGLHLIPKDVTFDNYMQVFKNRYLWNGYKNTILRTVIGTVVQLFFTAMSAYAISKPYFPHRGFWTFYVVFTMFFSGGMIPSYLLIKNLHLFDTMAVLILPGLVGAYNMVLMRNFFSSLPEELEESCMIDGAGRFTIFFRIVLPCSKPILATVALWLAVADVFWAMARFGGEEMCVLPTYAVSTGSPINVVYNKQWLDNLNAEVPETLDEFVELMYRFTNEDPDGNGKDDTYGFSTSMLNVIFGAYGSFPGFLHMDYGHWYEVDGKLVSSNVMDGNEEALKLIKQLYDDGVIDPEFITGENKGGYWALSHSFMNGRIGVTHSAAHYHYQPALYDKEGNQIVADGACLAEFKAIQGEDAEVVVGPWPEGPNGDRGGFLRYNFGIVGGTVYNAALNDDPEKLAAIFAIRDIFLYR